MDNMFINLDNITNIVKFDERFIRIYFFNEYYERRTNMVV